MDIAAQVEEIYAGNASQMPHAVADKLKISEREVIENLPGDMAVEAPASDFETIWGMMVSWQAVTVIVQNNGIIAEIKGKLSKGRHGHGFFNLMDPESPLHGHIRVEAIDAIFLVSKPFMGMASHSVQFYDAAGTKLFAVYLGREDKQIIPSVLEGYQVLRALYQS